MNHIKEGNSTRVKTIIGHGKSWYRGGPPQVFFIEDEEKTQQHIVGLLEPLFPGIRLRLARSIEKAKAIFAEDQVLYDFVILDHRILVRDGETREGTEEELVEFLQHVLRLGETRCRFLIRVTAYRDQADRAADEVIGLSGGKSTQLLRLSCLMEKNSGWGDLVIAYFYRSLALKNVQGLEEELARFDLDRLNGTKPGARPRHGRLDGAEEFEATVAELARWWPFLSRWPEDSLQTRSLLEPLVHRVRHYFEVDESNLNDETGDGEVSLTLKFQPGPFNPSTQPVVP